MTRSPQSALLAPLDATCALGILTFCLLPGSHLHHTLSELYSYRLTILDVMFALTFVAGWGYCFHTLKLYDTFATVKSRMVATLKGVVIMTIVGLFYYAIVHPGVIVERSVIETVAALFTYEVNRLALSVYLLDRLAARDPRRAIIVGSGRRASKAWRAVRTRYRSSLTLVGFIDDRNPEEMSPDVARRYLGTIDDLEILILKDVVDIVLIAMPIQSCYPVMQKAVNIAESAGASVIYLEDIYTSRQRKEDPNALIFRELGPSQEQYLLFLAAKRVIDIVIALTGLIVLSPFLMLIAVAVRLTSKGPAIFKQERYGQHRRRFTMFKFRSMIHGAEDLLAGLEHVNEASGPIFKIKNDPRITKLGKFLRTTSLDELPQLWNVVRGEMSLVGPRPMSVRDVSRFDHASLMRRFTVRPGMTGLWQVSGRSETGFDQWVLMDNHYIDGRCLSLDIKILARTVGVVLRRSGAK